MFRNLGEIFKYLSLSSYERYIKTWKVLEMGPFLDVVIFYWPRSHVFERGQVNPKKLRVKGRISLS